MWKKENKIVTRVNSVVIDEQRVFNPTDEQIIADGWEIYETTVEQHEKTNEEIREQREQQYKIRSDSLFIAWKKYEANGEIEKAMETKIKWLEETEKINEEFPYNE